MKEIGSFIFIREKDCIKNIVNWVNRIKRSNSNICLRLTRERSGKMNCYLAMILMIIDDELIMCEAFVYCR